MKTSYIILILLFAVSMEAQWSNDPNNNLIIGYGADPHICSDSTGGCYITYNAGEPKELFLRRLDKYGYQPWGYKKQILGELEEQWQAEIIEDGEGGVIVSYEDFESNLPFAPTQRIRVQKVDSSGNFLWGQTGVKVSIVDTIQAVQRIVSDGDGGCVIVWVESNIGFTEYKMNRIDRNGQWVWSDRGVYIQSDINDTPARLKRASDGNYYLEIRENIYRIMQNGEFTLWNSSNDWWLIVPAPEGGGIVHSAIWSPSYYTLLAQRKDTLGNNLWQEPYVEIADSLFINTQLRIQRNSNYFYYGWSGRKEGTDQVAQFQALRLDGSILFDQGSIALIKNRQSSLNSIFPSDSTRTIFVFWNHPNLPDSTFAQLYDTLGNKLWDENGVLVGHPAIVSQNFTTDGNGGFIIGGVIDNFTVVAQQVSRNGQLGDIITSVKSEEEETIPVGPVLYQNYPNPFNSSTIIKYSIPSEGQVTIELYNVIGELIKTITDGFFSAGIHTVNLSSDELPSGIYLYRLQTETKSLTKKLIIIK